MTKEEILIKNNCLSVKTSDGIIYDTYVPQVHIDNMREALEEYAKQERIAFAEFIKNEYFYWAEGDWCSDIGASVSTTEELDQLYLKSKK